MNFKRMIQLSLMFLAMLIVLAPIFKGLDLANLHLISFVYILTLIFLFELKVKVNVSALIVTFVLYSITTIGVRLCYLNYDVGSLQFEELVSIDSPTLVFTVFMLWLSTLFLGAGLVMGSYLKTSDYSIRNFWQSILPSFCVRESFLFKYILLLIPVAWFTAIWANRHHGDYWVDIVSILLGYMAVFYLFIGYCVLHWERFSIKKKRLVFIICILFLIMRVLVGSKGGIYQLCMGFLLAMVVVKSSFTIPLRAFFIFALIIPPALVFYFCGQEARYLLQTFVENDISVHSYYTHFSILIGNIFTENLWSYFSFIIKKSFAMLDYLNVLYNYQPVNDFLSLSYTFKTMWNAVIPHYLLPGFYFDEATILPARLFRLAYGWSSYSDVVAHYHTDYLPFFGFLFVNIGGVSLLIVFLFGVLVSWIYKQFPTDNKNCWFFYKIVYVYCFISTLFAMGPATMFVELIQCFLLPGICYFLLQNLLGHSFIKFVVSSKNRKVI